MVTYDVNFHGWRDVSESPKEKFTFPRKSKLRKRKIEQKNSAHFFSFSRLNKIWKALKDLEVERDPDARWMEYYITGKYRGFYKKGESVYKLSHITQLVFTNGEKEVYASGGFKEEALHKIFNRIDRISRFDKIE